MESNRDEAERALSIAQKKLNAGDLQGAQKFALKSDSLFPSDKAKQLLTQLSQQSTTAAKQASTTDQPGETLRQRKPTATKKTTEETGSSSRAYTEKQHLAVKEVMKAKHDYYRVLGLESKAASEMEIKKAYRKAALVFHPDKNTAPGADEAFKLVAHAFTVLSDGDKRAHYDRFGAETSTGGRSSSSASSAGMYNRGAGYAQYGDEMSAEDLFNVFFGGDLGQFGVQFGPNVRFATRGHPPQQQQRRGFQSRTHHRHDSGDEQEDGGVLRACLQFLPLVLLVFSLFSTSLISLLFGSEQTPSYAFERSYGLTKPMVTANRAVSYWVNDREFSRYLGQGGARNRFEREVEASYVSVMQNKCIQQRRAKRDKIYMAQGWFLGMGGDPEKLREAQEIPLPACDEVRRMT
ncbi:Chaperone protein dnaJ [Coemansia sp. RSA 1722]|nr:Chaperone protein dnaJ [Coemansia sp. RSA 485]KAJ2602453.1 Chaperone protein dnaJ [Coemansia sp. RSA 1721]KAJ2605976.1 Chaperone protein dnaJ [Coemansia sp. RSA 1722]KAJ2639636.1 Chaperone protein dnaJ [Coemansia sp. RSA 1286]